MKKTILRVGTLLLAVITLIPFFAACTGTSEPEVTTPEPEQSENITDEKTDAQTELETEAVKNYVVINADNAESVKLIRSADLPSKSSVTDLFVAFRKELGKSFEKDFEVKDDFIMPGETIDPEAIEIYVGDAEREESDLLSKKLEATGTHSYGILVNGNKIAINGTSLYLLFKALDCFMQDHISKDDAGNPQIKIEDGYEFIATSEDAFPSPREVIDSGREYAFYSLEKLAKVVTKGGFKTLQGGGTDGKYAYYCVINKTSSPETAIIQKVDMTTWKVVATSQTISSAHSNDIAYDSKNNRLVICTCTAADGYRGYVFVDPDTLEFIEYTVAPTAGRAIDYIPETNQYLVALEYGYLLTNDKLETIESKPDGFPKLTTQGFCTDGDLIFDPRWDSKASYQTISVNTMAGEFIGGVPLYNIDGEPEFMFQDGNSFIMGCNKSMGIFRIALLYKNWWE